jgi:hypothetical protein
MRLNSIPPAIFFSLTALASANLTTTASANTLSPLNGEISHQAADLQQDALESSETSLNISPNFVNQNSIFSQNLTGRIIKEIQIQFVNSEGETKSSY